MNLIFNSVLLFLIFLPGLLFRLTYYSYPYSRKIVAKDFGNLVFYSIIPGLIIQTFGLLITNLVGSYEIRIDHIILLLQGTKDSSLYQYVLSGIQISQGQILLYNLIINLTAIALALISRSIIRNKGWDRKERWLRFSNRWFYVFNGEILDFPEIPDSSDDVNTKVIDALVELNGENILYIGYFYDYQLKPDGSLDGVYLQYPMRRSFDDQFSGNYYEISSRFIFLKYESIANMNFRYFKIERQ